MWAALLWFAFPRAASAAPLFGYPSPDSIVFDEKVVTALEAARIVNRPGTELDYVINCHVKNLREHLWKIDYVPKGISGGVLFVVVVGYLLHNMRRSLELKGQRTKLKKQEEEIFGEFRSSRVVANPDVKNDDDDIDDIDYFDRAQEERDKNKPKSADDDKDDNKGGGKKSSDDKKKK